MHFTEKLRRLMQRHGLTQTSVGASVGVSHRAVGKWLAGDSRPGPDIAKKLADYFRMSVEDLMDDAQGLAADLVLEEMQARYQLAADAMGKIPADQQVARQAQFEKHIARGQHRLTLKETAARLRALADEIDPPSP